MLIVFIDNFDSFTFNIVQAFQTLGHRVHVVRNHAVKAEEILEMNPSLLVLGPGPGNPKSAGNCKACVSAAAGKMPLFGICLGLQTIGEVFGGNVIRAERVMHGKISAIYHTNEGLFRGMPQGFRATRYHSLILDRNTLPEELEVTAWTEQEEIMGVRHRSFPIAGVQFHPESIMTEEGLKLLENCSQVLDFKIGAEIGETGLFIVNQSIDSAREKNLSATDQIAPIHNRKDLTGIMISD